MMKLFQLFTVFIFFFVLVAPIPGKTNESTTVLQEESDSTFIVTPESEVIVESTEVSEASSNSIALIDPNDVPSQNNVNNELLSENNDDTKENSAGNHNSTEIKTNSTLSSPNRSDAAYKIYRNCLTDKVYSVVEVVNATRLMELLIIDPSSSAKTENKKDIKISPRTCLLVLFYSRWCVFSSHAAPHFNALPRYFPHIKIVAIDASKYQNFNTQFGIVGVPTLMFVYNGKPLVKFNDTSYTLESFARFVTEYTALKPNGSLYVTSADFSGPVPSTPSNETDYCLVLSWVFIAACAIYFTLQSQWWKQFVELIQNTWRESNAQHEHTD